MRSSSVTGSPKAIRTKSATVTENAIKELSLAMLLIMSVPAFPDGRDEGLGLADALACKVNPMVELVGLQLELLGLSEILLGLSCASFPLLGQLE